MKAVPVLSQIQMGAYYSLQVMCPRVLARKVFSALSTHKGDSGRRILAAILLTPGKVGILEFLPVSSSSLLLFPSLTPLSHLYSVLSSLLSSLFLEACWDESTAVKDESGGERMKVHKIMKGREKSV